MGLAGNEPLPSHDEVRDKVISDLKELANVAPDFVISTEGKRYSLNEMIEEVEKRTAVGENYVKNFSAGMETLGVVIVK